jgi:cytidyltransferase-like protein
MEGKFSKVTKVWVNGTFDVFHPGHLALLKFAAKNGELHVGTDTDRRISEKKGPDRPFFNLEQRMEMLESIKYVSRVYSFDSDEELVSLMQEVDPDVMVIGSDYRGKNIVGSHIPRDIVFFERIEGISTTEILGKNEDNNSHRREVY